MNPFDMYNAALAMGAEPDVVNNFASRPTDHTVGDFATGMTTLAYKGVGSFAGSLGHTWVTGSYCRDYAQLTIVV